MTVVPEPSVFPGDCGPFDFGDTLRRLSHDTQIRRDGVDRFIKWLEQCKDLAAPRQALWSEVGFPEPPKYSLENL